MRRVFAVVGVVAFACGGSGAGSPGSGDGGGVGGFGGAAGATSGGSGGADASLGGAGGAVVVCAPGQQVQCACGGAAVGYQVCNKDGTGYNDCVCSDGGSGGTGGTDAGIGGIGPGDAGPDATSCVGATVTASQLAPYLYVMLDKSSSMLGFKWDATKTALSNFVSAPASAGINVGLKVFPRAADATPVCDQVAYKNSDVAFGLLPANATALSTALSAINPDGLSTPVWPALGGAVLKGIELTQSNPGHTAAVLLMTDGIPQGPAALCGSIDPTSTSEIAKLAQSGAAWVPPVNTHVIGLPGVDQSFANAVAMAGGTGAALIVGNTNVTQEVTNALATVRSKLPCEFELPSQVSSGQVSMTKVNVQLTLTSGKQVLKNTPNCGANSGWMYTQTTPKRIALCSAECAQSWNDASSSVEIMLGCSTLM